MASSACTFFMCCSRIATRSSCILATSERIPASSFSACTLLAFSSDSDAPLRIWPSPLSASVSSSCSTRLCAAAASACDAPSCSWRALALAISFASFLLAACDSSSTAASSFCRASFAPPPVCCAERRADTSLWALCSSCSSSLQRSCSLLNCSSCAAEMPSISARSSFRVPSMSPELCTCATCCSSLVARSCSCLRRASWACSMAFISLLSSSKGSPEGRAASRNFSITDRWSTMTRCSDSRLSVTVTISSWCFWIVRFCSASCSLWIHFSSSTPPAPAL
mmetsp:Transcript_49315/g.120272  ORF Transcript_49315/g.120272 Transcript_49315/m.120272 type:complete len:281 (-) Transcript_49315:356-1198(-)